MDRPLNKVLNTESGLFWDVDPASLDAEKHKYYIIPRVMDYGTLEHVKETFRHYGVEAILEVLKQVPSLDKKTISFFATRYDIPREEFRAYRRSKKHHTWR